MKKRLAVILAVILLSISIFPVHVMANNGHWETYEYEGSYYYYYMENNAIQYGWIKHNGYWYYCTPLRVENSSYDVDGKTYYFDADGKMVTGWQYLLTTNGSYEWFYFNSSGAMMTGWQKISGKWYYMSNTGIMQTGWLEDGGKWYYLTSSGAMATGWQWLPTKSGYGWFYFNSSGAELVGWQKIGGYWYYLDEAAYTGDLFIINGKKYLFASSGKMLTGWQKWLTDKGTTEWFYFDSSGAMYIGWLKYGGYWYYLNESMAYGGWMQINGTWYQFDYNGRWIG